MMLVLSFSINTRSSLSTSITIVLSATPPGLRMKERESLWIHNFPELVFFFRRHSYCRYMIDDKISHSVNGAFLQLRHRQAKSLKS